MECAAAAVLRPMSWLRRQLMLAALRHWRLPLRLRQRNVEVADWVRSRSSAHLADVWPGSYGEVPLKDAWIGDQIRDLYDLALVEAFEQAGKPIFGVCRGLQLINVALAARSTRTSRPSTRAACATATR